MFCSNCGKQIPDGSQFCPECGEKLSETKNEEVNQTEGEVAESMPKAEPKKISFVDAIKLYWTNYVNFTGRATKREFWFAFLFEVIATSIITVISQYASAIGVLSLAFVIPSLSITIRRLRDVGHKWTRIFWGLCPIVGTIILIIDFCKDSVPESK